MRVEAVGGCEVELERNGVSWVLKGFGIGGGWLLDVRIESF